MLLVICCTNIIYRNTETANTLNDKAICSEPDGDSNNDDDDNDCVPPPNPYECQSYFKTIRDFAVAQNNSEL